MEKLNLVKWNDKKAEDILDKISYLEKNVNGTKDSFELELKRIQVDTANLIPYSFEPGDYKV